MENAGIRFNTHDLSEEFTEKTFSHYVERTLKNAKTEPFCPFPKGGYCDISPEDRLTACLSCDCSRESFQEIMDYIYQKTKRTGAKVFCINCGAGKRTPLRKWHNVYICENCWKLKNVIGEEAFIEDLKGEKK